jgi:uncharacterized membrane protein
MATDIDCHHQAANRLDSFVDAAFAFAVTLLVIASAAPPVNLDDLGEAVGRIPSSACAFALIALFWFGHKAFGRLTRKRDVGVQLISLAIVFTVLVYVYPLRLLTQSFFFWVSGGRLPGHGIINSFESLGMLYVVYGVGFAVLAGLYAALFGHGVRSAAALEIEGQELQDARDFTAIWLILMSMGLLSALLASWGGLMRAAPWLPGFAYSAIPVLIYGRMGLQRLKARRLPPA